MSVCRGVLEDFALVGAPSKPAKDLDPPGRQIREAREDELRLSSEAFAQLLDYEGSHIRNVELGNSGYGGIAERCELVAASCEVDHTAKVLAGLAAFLRSFKPDTSKDINPRRGTERKQDRDQSRTAEHLVGEWWAIWQMSRHGEEVQIGETVLVTASGNGRGLKMANRGDSSWAKAKRSENAAEPGGPDQFLRWSATCRLTKNARWVNGDFTSLSTANNVDGVFRLMVGGFPEAIVGDWLGESWDSERTHGLLVFARSKELAEKRFDSERGKASGPPCIPT